jgi:Sulfotransferase domain
MLRVIGTGFGRTGTLSTKAALERLSGGSGYHMYEALAHLDDLPVWMRADEGAPDSLREVLDGHTATVDWPGCSSSPTPAFVSVKWLRSR